jgi:hypothetical protein
LVILLLGGSALAAVFAPACWWILWPRQTARDFIAMMAADRSLAVREMLSDAMDENAKDIIVYGTASGTVRWNQSALKMNPRTLRDMIRGRQEFTMETIPGYIFKVENGSIDWAWPPFHDFSPEPSGVAPF